MEEGGGGGSGMTMTCYVRGEKQSHNVQTYLHIIVNTRRLDRDGVTPGNAKFHITRMLSSLLTVM